MSFRFLEVTLRFRISLEVIMYVCAYVHTYIHEQSHIQKYMYHLRGSMPSSIFSESWNPDTGRFTPEK